MLEEFVFIFNILFISLIFKYILCDADLRKESIFYKQESFRIIIQLLRQEKINSVFF